jgi:hypothetical protein
MRELIKEGENQAIRCFLMLYGGNSGLTIGQMKKHMTMAGYPLWPNWVIDDILENHLTKWDVQDWIRYLFSLENK